MVFLWSRGQSPPEPPGCLILEDLHSPHPHKQETTGLDTIQATSFFPWWLLLFFQENFEAQGDLLKILRENKTGYMKEEENKLANHYHDRLCSK